MKEHVVRFGPQDGLVGVLTRPVEDAFAGRRPAFLLANSGIVHRVGPHRLYVKLARRLASLGFPVLRFDLSAIGDSQPRDDLMDFDESSVADAQEAMSCLERELGVDRFVVSGICSGGKLAYLAACHDARVVGAIPINAGLHLHAGADPSVLGQIAHLTLSRHFWRIALFSSFRRKNWAKALRGQLNVLARLRVMLLSLLRSRRRNGAAPTTEPGRGALTALAERDVRLFHIYAEGDEWLDYFNMFLGKQARTWPADGPLRVEVIRGSDHTFTMLWSQEHLMDLICDWAQDASWPAGSPGVVAE